MPLSIWERLLLEDSLEPGPEVSEEPPPKKKDLRNMDTPESRAFWEGVKRSADYARTLPAWMRTF